MLRAQTRDRLVPDRASFQGREAWKKQQREKRKLMRGFAHKVRVVPPDLLGASMSIDSPMKLNASDRKMHHLLCKRLPSRGGAVGMLD